jgi:hypothetical protein
MLFLGWMLVLIVWVLLPLIPAILIFKLFPDTRVAASGLFADLTVRATGAFAAYLIVFASIVGVMLPLKDDILNSEKPWEISGVVTVKTSDNQDVDKPEILESLLIETLPKSFSFDSGRFNKNAFYDPNFLYFGIPNFGKTIIDMQNCKDRIKIDRGRKRIILDIPITVVAGPGKTVNCENN